jgi:hypothetical protein
MILAFLGGWIWRGIGIGMGSLCMGMDGWREDMCFDDDGFWMDT